MHRAKGVRKGKGRMFYKMGCHQNHLHKGTPQPISKEDLTLENISFHRARHNEGGGVAALALLMVEIAGDMLAKMNCTRSVSPSIALSANMRNKRTACSGRDTTAQSAAKIG
jgi:hypothetical protein